MQTIMRRIIVATAVLGLMDEGAGSSSGILATFDALESLGERHIDTMGDLDDYTNRLHNLARLQTARAFSIETRRHRRDLDMTSLQVTGTKEFTVPTVDEVHFNASAFENVTDVHVLNTEAGEFWILSYNSTRQLLVEATPSGLQLLDEFHLAEGLTRIDYLTSHVVDGQLCVAIASNLNSSVQTLLVGSSKATVATIQTIAMDGAVGGLHMFGSLGNLYLVVGARPVPNSVVPERKSRIYILRNKHFARLDYLDFRPCNVTDVIGFSHRGFYYLVFSMFHSAGSEVYKFDVNRDTMTFHQQIPESDGLDLAHFYEMQEGKHYVVLRTAVSAKIYRWASEQLLLWQVLDSSSTVNPISSIHTFTASSLETIILVASGGRVIFYADDIFASFQPSFLMVTDCDSIERVSLVQINGDYVILYICRTVSGKFVLDSRQVLMEEITLEKPVNPITKCILDLEFDLEARKPNILLLEETFADNLVMTTEGSQTWSASVIFEEGLTVDGKTTFQHPVSIKGHAQPLPLSFEEFFSKTALLEGEVRSVKSGLPDLLYHSGNQVFRGSITVATVSADTFESNATILTQLNGWSLPSLAEVFMIDGFDQNVSSAMSFNTMACETFVTRGNMSSASINGIATNEFMRRNEASQKITGRHTYRNLTAENISGLGGEGSTLGINAISTNDIVTMGTSVTLLDKKTIKNMSVFKRTNLHFLNSVDLSTLKDDLVFKNLYSTQILAGNYSFGTVKVTGNADVTLINDVNFKLLETRTVKKSRDFKLSGKVNYQNMTVATLDSPKLNNISWSNMVRDDTTTISGNYHFLNATVTTSVVSDSVNGLDISEDVVTINTAQNLKGKLTFTDDLVVNGSQGLQMSQGSTINNIDPLSLLSMDHLGNLIIKSNVTLNSSLQVSDHVIADVINGLDMSSMEKRYWRKAYPQDVIVSPNLKSATFGGSLMGRTINGHQMTDFFMREGLQIIYGSYSFEEAVRATGSISVKSRKTINGIDLSALEQNTVTRDNKENINAETSFAGKLTVSTDLTLNGKLNGWNVTSDFLRLDLTSQHTGNLTFASKASANSLSIANAHLVAQSLNGLDVKASADDLVLANEDTTINGSLVVTGTAKINQLNLRGTVDKVDLEDLAVRSLKKSATAGQLATGMLVVDEVVFRQSPSLEVVNSKNWTAHLTSVVGLDYNGTVRGKKTFTQPLTVVGDFNPNLTNGAVNVSALGLEILTKNNAQNITQRYTFTTNITATNVNANVIDSVNTSNLLLVDQGSFISGTVAFTENVVMTNLLSRSSILDGCNITQVNKTAIWKSENGSMDIDFWFSLNGMVVTQDVSAATVEAGTHKRDMINFLDNVVTITKTQDIYGMVDFYTDVQIRNLTAKFVDGVDMDTFYNVTVLDKKEIVINCDMEFLKTLSTGKLTIDSSIIGRDGGKVLINDLNVSEINDTALLSTGGTYVMTGTKSFPNGFNTNELSVEGSISNLPVADLVVFSNSSKLPSYITFKVPITVKGNAQIGGLLDGVNLEELLANRIKLDTAEALSSSITFSDVKVEGDLVVDTINNIRFAEIVLRSGRNLQKIVGYKNFEGMFVNGEIEAQVINGINVTNLDETVVMKTRSAAIENKVIFTKNVTVNNVVDVIGTVNNNDLSELNGEYLEFKENLKDKSQVLKELNATLLSLQTGSLLPSCSVYETLSYAEVIRVTDVGVYGKMTVGDWEGNSLVIVRQCDGERVCSCPIQYVCLIVDTDNNVEATSRSSGSAFIFDINGYSTAGVINTCTDGGNGSSLIKLRQGLSTEFTTDALGIVSDVATFVAENNGFNVTYIITVGAIEEWDTDGMASINVLRLDKLQVRLVWSMPTAYSAASVDLTSCEFGWVMLVANKKAANDSVDPYTVPSQIYLWSETEEKFSLQGEYLGQHVTSGMFLRTKARLEEQFFTLTQLKSVDPPVLKETRRYRAEVLVYRHDGWKYKPYQKLRSYGVVGQTYVFVGDDLFLCLLSSVTKTVDIYEHRVSEGFRLFQKIRVCDQPVDVVMMRMSTEFLLVSCMDRQMMTIQLHRKGYSYINET